MGILWSLVPTTTELHSVLESPSRNPKSVFQQDPTGRGEFRVPRRVRQAKPVLPLLHGPKSLHETPPNRPYKTHLASLLSNKQRKTLSFDLPQGPNKPHPNQPRNPRKKLLFLNNNFTRKTDRVFVSNFLGQAKIWRKKLVWSLAVQWRRLEINRNRWFFALFAFSKGKWWLVNCEAVKFAKKE